MSPEDETGAEAEAFEQPKPTSEQEKTPPIDYRFLFANHATEREVDDLIAQNQ